MSVGLRSRETGKFLCVPPGQPEVFADHDQIDRCGQVQVIVWESSPNRVSIRFDESGLYYCIPDPPNKPKDETRTVAGLWETFDLAADRKSISRAGRIVDLVGFDVPPPKLFHLEQRGNDFIDAAGQRVVYAGVDGFDDLWFRVTGRESELDALMAESKQIGFTVRRAWCMGDAGENQVFSMYPQNIPGYFDLARSLVAYENGYGVIPLFTCFVDAQRVIPDADARLRFWSQFCAALVGAGAYLLSGGNQYPKNGFDPWADLASPGPGVIWSRGSSTDDLQTAPRGATASELHATRVSCDRALMDATASPPNMRSVSNSGMVWMTEGNPFGDSNGYSERQAWELGRGYSILWSLAVFHNRQSQRGQLMTDETARCAAAWVKGMRL